MSSRGVRALLLCNLRAPKSQRENDDVEVKRRSPETKIENDERDRCCCRCCFIYMCVCACLCLRTTLAASPRHLPGPSLALFFCFFAERKERASGRAGGDTFPRRLLICIGDTAHAMSHRLLGSPPAQLRIRILSLVCLEFSAFPSLLSCSLFIFLGMCRIVTCPRVPHHHPPSPRTLRRTSAHIYACTSSGLCPPAVLALPSRASNAEREG